MRRHAHARFVAMVAATIVTAVLCLEPVFADDTDGVMGRTKDGRVRHPPVVARFTPAGGPPGTRVALSGQAFGTDVRVAFGTRPLTILGRPTPDTLTVAIPADAKASAPFVVTTPDGETRSGAWFQVELPATAQSLSPTSGPPGTRITLRGSGFHGEESVQAGTEELRVLERHPWGVVLEAPAHRGGPLIMVFRGRSVALPFRFDVVAVPAIASFTPAEGPPGTRVTLHGSGLGAADRVSYGGLSCPIQKRGDDVLVVDIPAAAAGEAAFSVEASGQSVSSADAYRVTAARGP